MFETAQKYTDYEYSSKQKVASDFQYRLIDPIWEEIETYRAMFRWSVSFAKDYYITRNAYINDRINEVSELLYRVNYDHQQDQIQWAGDVRLLSNTQQIVISQFIQEVQLGIIGDPQNNLLCLLDRCHLHGNIQKLHLQCLLDDQISIIIRLFLAIECFDKVTSYVLIIYLLGSHKMLYPLTFLPITKLFDENIINPVQYDLTYKLIIFVDKLRLNLSTQVVSLCRNARTDVRIMSKQELRECYPMLSHHQIAFYVDHHLRNHFYTIADYMSFTSVCYETARYSLDGLVEQNWYQKQLIGKKFMYFV